MTQMRARTAGGVETLRQGAHLLSSAVRRQIVEHLEALPRVAAHGRPRRDQGLTAKEISDVLGLHVTTARFHLDQLLAAGLLESHFVRQAGAGRPSKKYVVADGDLEQVVGPEAPAGAPYQVLATLLAASVPDDGSDGLTPEEAGVQWVRRRWLGEHGTDQVPADNGSGDQHWREQVGAVVDLLGEWGYTPELSGGEDGSEVLVTLRECPFIELASTHPAVVCGIHRGLLRGALEAAGEPGAGVSLRPFVGARTCHAVLTRRGQGPDGLDLSAPAAGDARGPVASPTPGSPDTSGAPHRPVPASDHPRTDRLSPDHQEGTR